MRLVNWGEEPSYGRLEPIRLPLPAPERLPARLSDLVEELLRLGGDFRVLGRPGVQSPGEIVQNHDPTACADLRPFGGPGGAAGA